ncbi:UNVERIFIED_ORG: hypothetical protein M2312_004861 [Rhizobium esperanzae]|nr:hypothetical protein [Rhizobium esperanzae]
MTRTPMITVKPVHFEDYDGLEFERLVFAYLLWAGWRDVTWYGQTGSDLGRDIIATESFDDVPDRRTVIQCVNRKALTLAKATRDMTRASAAETGPPDAFLLVCRAKVSAEQRDKVTKVGKELGISHVTIWSGVEFEEHLRLRGEFLLRRFVDGETFPDDGEGLLAFVNEFAELSDQEALALLRLPFDRPAFRTPFHEEARLFDFQDAISNTISALNTGVWTTREGVEIRRLPSIQHIRDSKMREELKGLARDLDGLRRLFKLRMQDGSIKHCECGDPRCGMFQLREGVAGELDSVRNQLLDRARRIIPDFDVCLG